MRHPFTLVAVLALLAAACADLPAPTGESSAPTSTTTSITAPTTTTTAPPATGCEGDSDRFVEDGPVSIVGSGDSDASQISSLAVFPSGVCERFEIGLITDGLAPATSAPETSVEILADAGIVRVQFNGQITSTAVTDSLIESALVERAFVVRALSGGLFVDLHLSQPVAARALELRNPARVAVELRPGGLPVGLGSAIGQTVVVTSPTQRVVEYPFEVHGYARTFEANVIARLLVDGATAEEYVTTAADWLETWGEFRIEIGGGPGGDISLFIGEESAQDGSPIGVELDLNAG